MGTFDETLLAEARGMLNRKRMLLQDPDLAVHVRIRLEKEVAALEAEMDRLSLLPVGRGQQTLF